MVKLWSMWLDATRFGFEAQSVIALRLMKMASGGDASGVEARRMVSEKVAAIGASQLAMVSSLARGHSAATAFKRAATPFKKRVRANRKRLTHSGH